LPKIGEDIGKILGYLSEDLQNLGGKFLKTENFPLGDFKVIKNGVTGFNILNKYRNSNKKVEKDNIDNIDL